MRPQEQSHGQIQFLLNATLIALTLEINLRTELNVAEDVGDGHLHHYPEAGFALDLLQCFVFASQLFTHDVRLLGQFVVYIETQQPEPIYLILSSALDGHGFLVEAHHQDVTLRLFQLETIG